MKSSKIAVVLLVVVLLIAAYYYITMLVDMTGGNAAELHTQWFPMIYVNFQPHRTGCELPDSANCNSEPPFSVPNLP